MSWFEEQLLLRERRDDAELDSALGSIADAVMGKRLQRAFSRNETAYSAIDEVLKYYRFPVKYDPFPKNITSAEEKIDYRVRPYGIKTRTVTFEKNWYRSSAGALIGTLKKDGSAVALIPGRFSGYDIIDIRSGKKTKLNRKTEKLLDTQAVCFYEPFPQKTLKMADLVRFMLRQLNLSDILLYLLLLGITSALGLLSPVLTKWLFGDVLASGDKTALVALAVFVVCFSLSSLLFDSFRSLITARVGVKQDMAVQAAIMSRIMSLPANFFRSYASGDLAQRATFLQEICSTLFSSITVTGLTSIFSLIYIGQIFVYAPSLAVPSVLIILSLVLVSVFTVIMQMRIAGMKMDISARISGLTYSTITGMQKIKTSGAAKRMFSRWARFYSREAQLEYDPPPFLKLSGTISLAISLIGTMVLFALAIANGVEVSDYYAFNAAYGMVTSAFMSLISIAVTVARIRPTVRMANPILETEPEAHTEKESVTELRGAIELSHVSFRYDETMPNVIDDLSLRISPGEYLAVVGSTGCGKSTLLRLLLGFETPQKGLITFDKKDISKLDKGSLRKKIGAVLQDGKLFLGDIYSNIVITSPELGLDEAWEAARIASLDEDIRNMPMEMSTVISEGQGGISGGQKQRLMIARAVAAKPKILMFDEATSALDNITQKKVSDAIDSLECTRIVIAHRLSTVKNAHRIIFLDKGRIAEEGTYEELIAKNGLFAKLVERQRLDNEM